MQTPNSQTHSVSSGYAIGIDIGGTSTKLARVTALALASLAAKLGCQAVLAGAAIPVIQIGKEGILHSI